MWQLIKKLMVRLGRRDGRSPLPVAAEAPGEFVYYTTFHPGCRMAVQQTMVVRRDDCKSSEYIIWLN